MVNPERSCMAEKTYWNGEAAQCRRVRVRVAESDEMTPPPAWWRGLEGSERWAVEVLYGEGPPFYLDDDEVTPELHAAHEEAIGRDPKMARLLAFLPPEQRNLRGRAGDGWCKVTEGKGSPRWGHRSLPVAQVLEGAEVELAKGGPN